MYSEKFSIIADRSRLNRFNIFVVYKIYRTFLCLTSMEFSDKTNLTTKFLYVTNNGCDVKNAV